jgi:hypothetical protein
MRIGLVKEPVACLEIKYKGGKPPGRAPASGHPACEIRHLSDFVRQNQRAIVRHNFDFPCKIVVVQSTIICSGI